MIWTALHALSSHWLRKPWQFLTLITGLAMATALWSGVQAINGEARASYAQAADTLSQGQAGFITRRDRAPLELAQYVTLRRAGWLVSPILEGQLTLDDTQITLTGVEPLTLPAQPRTSPTNLNGDADGFMAFISGVGVIIAHPDDADALEGLGPELRIDTTQTPGRALTDIGVAEKLLNREGEISRLLISENQPLSRIPLAEIAPELVQENIEDQADLSRLTDSFHLNLTAFGLLAFAVGIFIVYGAIGLAFEQRRPVFRTLRALGLPLRYLIGLLALELSLFALIAGTLGVAFGYLIAGWLLPDVAATLRGLYGAEVSGQLTLRPSLWLSGLCMAALGTLAAASGAFWRLRRLPLLSSSQPSAWTVQTARITRLLALAAFLLGVVSLIAGLVGSGLVAGFVCLAALLIGAALALPALLDLALRIAGQFSTHPIAQWFWADTRQQLPGLSMALMALLLAMSANIGVSTMVSSFRVTFVQFLDQRLASELYLRAASPSEAREMTDFVTPLVDAVLPIVSVDARIGGLPAEIYGVVDHQTYRNNWEMLSAVPDVWDKLANGEGALVNEQLARRQNLSIGDPLPTANNDIIIGIFGDYGNPGGQVMLGSALFSKRYPDATAQRFGLRTRDPDSVALALRERFDLGPQGLINQEGIKAFSLSVFERTFSVTAALNVLTLSVAAFAILISLLTLATMRLPQLAPVWALGLTRRKLARLEMARALCLACLTGLMALPLGLTLSWVLLAVVNVEAFGWRLPMFFFPRDYLILGLLTVLAASLAAILPALSLARTPPSELLKVFSNET